MKIIKNKPVMYVVRGILSMIFLVAGITFLINPVQYITGVGQRAPSIHEMTEDEVEGRYVSISALRVTNVVKDALYVAVPLANGKTMGMQFSGSKEQKKNILSLQGKKNLKNFIGSDGASSDASLYFIPVDYAGTYQKEDGYRFYAGGVPTLFGVTTKASLWEYLAAGAALAGFGIFGLVSALINLLRKPKIVAVSEAQSIYSSLELERILSEKPIHENIWASERAILIMNYKKLTQINFYDITQLEFLEKRAKYAYIYSVQITDEFGKVHLPMFESRDTALAFACYLMKMAPKAEPGPALREEQSAARPQHTAGDEQQPQGTVLHQQHARELSQNMKQARSKNKKEGLYALAAMGILVAALILLGSVGLFLPKIIRPMMLGETADAVQILNTIIYSVAIPLVLIGILSIGLIVLVVYFLRRSGGYALAGRQIGLVLGGLAIFLGSMAAMEEVSFKEMLGAFEDVQQIRSGELKETEVYISAASHADVEALMGLIDDVGYQVSRISGVPTDIEYYSASSYYFPHTVDLAPYENTGYFVQSDYEENKNATVFRVRHTKNWRIIMDIEVAEE